ncbi:MAG: hypothetical protein NTW19_08385 [Planctomycetota bacterium]|nr:hypothetical protein [Planctomycetota bacterium]
MSGIKKNPTLRVKTVGGVGYRVTEVYRPDGKRAMLSFGPVVAMDDADAMILFGRWLKLFLVNPHKTLGYKTPFEAVKSMIDAPSILTIGDFRDKYLTYATDVFRLTRNNDINPNFQRLERALTYLAPYAAWPVASFGPDEFRAVQTAMVAYRYRRGRQEGPAKTGDASVEMPATQLNPEKSLTRQSINDHLDQLRRMWAWGVGRGIVTHQQDQSLREVRMLRPGAAGTLDGKKRMPITSEEFEKVVAAVNPTIGDMMRTMWLAPTRPGEVCRMRALEFLREDPSGIWLCVPGRDRIETGDSKTLHTGQVRAIPIAHRLQKILAPRIAACSSPTDYLFSPKVATAEFVAKRFAKRQTPLNCGNRPGTNRAEHPMIAPRDHYDDESFTKAIKKGCERAGVAPFTAQDIRRTSITRARAALGREAAATLAGHADPRTTDLYLLAEVQEAMRAAKTFDAAQG